MKISGQPAARVYCARSDQEWAAFADLHNVSAGAEGLTDIAARKAYLPADICRVLERRIRGQRVSLSILGPAIHTLVHEAQHLRGIVNEDTAECRALRLLPRVARDHFAFRSLKQIRALQAAARVLSYCY